MANSATSRETPDTLHYTPTERELTKVVQGVFCVVHDHICLVVGPLGRVEVHHLAPLLQDLHRQLSVPPLVHSPPGKIVRRAREI